MYRIHSGAVDAGGRLSPSVLCNFMQDAAGKHAQALGVSIDALRSGGHTWVLSRLTLNMVSWPAGKDRLVVRTWPAGRHRLFALRKFHLYNEGGRLLGEALTAWLVIGTCNRRPVRIDPYIERLEPVHVETANTALIDRVGALPDMAAFDREQRFTVRSDDLDMNRHVNNVTYIRWLLDGIPENVASSCRLRRLDIGFTAEGFLGESISSRCRRLDTDDVAFLHSVVKDPQARELARAKTCWRPA